MDRQKDLQQLLSGVLPSPGKWISAPWKAPGDSDSEQQFVEGTDDDERIINSQLLVAFIPLWTDGGGLKGLAEHDQKRLKTEMDLLEIIP